MPSQKSRINSPTIAMYFEDAHHIAVKVPAGSMVILDSETFNGGQTRRGALGGKESHDVYARHKAAGRKGVSR